MANKNNYNDFHLEINPAGITATYLKYDSHFELAKSTKTASTGNHLDLKKYSELISPIEEESLQDVNKSYESNHKDLGLYLYSILFHDGIDTLFHESYEDSKDSRDGLRLRLCINDSKLHNIAWEFVYDNTELDAYLCTLSSTPFTRFFGDVGKLKDLALDERSNEMIKQNLVAKTLLISANAYGAPNIKPGREFKEITESLKKITDKQGIIRIEPMPLEEPVTWDEVNEKLLHERYNILHFYGHGIFENGEAKLSFEARDGGEDRVGPDRFKQLFFETKSENMILVLLKACEGAKTSETNPQSGLAQSLVTHSLSHVSSVIAMQFLISISAAAHLAERLYREISGGAPIDVAVQRSRESLFGTAEFTGKRYFATPVLFLESKSGYIYDRLWPSPSNCQVLNQEILGKINVLDALKIEYNKFRNDEVSVHQFWDKKLRPYLQELTDNPSIKEAIGDNDLEILNRYFNTLAAHVRNYDLAKSDNYEPRTTKFLNEVKLISGEVLDKLDEIYSKQKQGT